jgi:hypothetical protein
MRTLATTTCIATALSALWACSAGDTPTTAHGSTDTALSEGEHASDLGGESSAINDDTGTSSAALRARRGRRPGPTRPPADPCATVRCAAGTHCEAQGRRAICAPDEPVNPCAVTLCPGDTLCEVIDGEAVCTPNAPPTGPFCGGIAGIPCPGAGSCVDDTSDDCDPENGGADCGGVCTCGNVLLLCIEGTVFDDSPEVCACVSDAPNPCAAALCPVDTTCEVVDGAPVCTPQTSLCDLVDCPPDRPRCEERDGEAVCVADAAPAPFCGGIAAFPCPGLGSCGDDPSDDCDPEQGGADCGGVCACNALALCVEGNVFDPSPEVCDCVPIAEPENPCATVLCAPGTRCVARGEEAHCVPRGRGCSHR